MFRNPPDVNSCKNNDFLMFYPYGKAGGFQIPRCQGVAVENYGVTLGALALKPSRFCNVGVYYTSCSFSVGGGILVFPFETIFFITTGRTRTQTVARRITTAIGLVKLSMPPISTAQ